MWWPFTKKEDKINEIKKSMEISFSNVKKDIELVKEAIKNLENKKEEHHTKIALLLDRFERLEGDFSLEPQISPEPRISSNINISKSNLRLFDSLTDKQKALCRVVAALYLESPNKWISLKTVSEDLNPNTNYDKVRSNLSEYTSLLEEVGFIKKRKKGRQSYIMSTSSNPYLKELQQINKLAKASKKRQDKKSKQS